MKSLMLAAAATAAFAIGGLATPSSAEAGGCYRGGGIGYGYGGGIGYGVGYRGVGYGYGVPAYRGYYAAPRAVTYYRGGGFGHPFYGPRRGGIGLTIGF